MKNGRKNSNENKILDTFSSFLHCERLLCYLHRCWQVRVDILPKSIPQPSTLDCDFNNRYSKISKGEKKSVKINIEQFYQEQMKKYEEERRNKNEL